MIGEQIQTNQDGTLTISCKIPAQWLPLLNTICAIKGANMNDLMKMCLQFLIETARVTTEPSQEMKVLLHMMKVSANWHQMFNFVTNGNFDIAQCILILQQSKDGKPREGFGLAMFNKPFMGGDFQTQQPDEEGYMTLCADEIVERVVEVAMGKDDYWDMRKVAQHFESKSIRETLVRMVDAQTILDLKEADHQELPGLDNFHDFGKRVILGQKYVRKRHRTPDSLANSQQRILFEDFDRNIGNDEADGGEHIGEHVSPEEIEETLGCKPFDVEP